MSTKNSRFSDKFVFLNDLLKLIIAMLLIVAIISIYLIFYISGGRTPATPVAEGGTRPETAPAEATSSQAAPATEEAGPELLAPTVDALAATEVTAGETVALSGTGTPGDELEIVANGESLGTATVGDDGTWSSSVSLPEAGNYELRVNSLTADGAEVASSTPVSLAVIGAASAFALPSLSLPDLSGLFAGDEVALSGNGEPGSEIEIVSNGEVIGTTTVDADGNWSFPWSFSDPGDYNLQVRTSGPDGSEVTSEPFSISIPVPDLELAVPTLDLPDFGDFGPGDEVEFSGTGTPGAEVEIISNGEIIGTVTVAEDGTWTFPFSFPEAGDYDLSVRTLDAEGKVVAESNSVANLAVATPTAEATMDDLASDEVETGTEVTFSGTGEPGSDLNIVANGEVIGTTTVADDGTWSFPFSFVEANEYDIEVQSLDSDGNELASAGPFSLSVTEAEASTPAAIATPTLETLAVTEFGTDETISLSGSGEPGSEVEVVADGRVFGVAPVDEDGSWRFAIAFSDPGTYDVFVRSVDADGNVLEATDPESVTVTAPAASERFAFIFPADGADIIVGRLTLIGTADPGQEVEVLDGETVLGTAETGTNGEWRFSAEPDLGSHAFAARLVDGNQTLDPLAVAVVQAADVDCETNLGISRGDNYIVGTCNTFGTVIERTGSTLELLIAANPQVENPDLIYPGDILNIP